MKMGTWILRTLRFNYRILIIEDDGDVRKFLETELGIYFEIISEPDGLSGLQKAQSFEVDLIICDVLMPGMNGFDVTRKLKRDFETSHIPIILLANEVHIC